jgi:phenylalanyl-tRNA synthetase beta chain
MGEKSLAVRLTLGSPDATLTDAQIDTAMNAVVEHLASTLGARLRA